jgi:predicted nucleotidyltransferase
LLNHWKYDPLIADHLIIWKATPTRAVWQQLPLPAEQYGVEILEVFGSYVRAKQKADSDLDILVTFREAPSLLTFIAI